MKNYSFADFGEGCAGDYLHLMTHPSELTRQVININTLPAAVRIPPIGQQANSHMFYLDGALETDNYSMFAGSLEVDFVQHWTDAEARFQD